MISINTSLWPQQSRQGHQIQNDNKRGKKKKARSQIAIFISARRSPPQEIKCLAAWSPVCCCFYARDHRWSGPSACYCLCTFITLCSRPLAVGTVSGFLQCFFAADFIRGSCTCFGSDSTWATAVLQSTPRPRQTREDLVENRFRLNVTASSISL